MLALATGLLYENLCKGIISYSGGLFLSSNQLNSSSTQTEICLIHGTDDPVVPYTASRDTRDHLTQRNNKVVLHMIPNLTHQINETGLLQGAQFIQSLAS